MKMISPLRSKPKRKISSKVIWLIGLFIGLTLILYFFRSPAQGVGFMISRPIWSVSEISAKPFTFIYNFFKTKNSLISENVFLKDEIAKLKLKEMDYDILIRENDELKTQLGREKGGTRIISKILSKPPFSPYDTFIVDAGENDGVMVGNRVFISDNVFIGVVQSVTGHTSQIKLFSGAGEKNEGVLFRTGSSFSLIGLGGGNFKVEVPKDTDLIWGDYFVSPSLSESVLGSVYFIDTNTQSSFKTAYLKIPTNVFASKYVFIENIR